MHTITAAQFFSEPAWRELVLLDVRSPGEFASGKLPGARSLPLFTDPERAEVGTLYKQESEDAALLRGLEIAGSKMRELVEDARRLAPGNRAVLHCWRGGQRSASVAWLLEKAGMEITLLEGGYKSARTHIRQFLATSAHPLRVLSGPTGSGKTDVLRAMAELGAQVIDLERLANHKGSSFGAIGEAPQPATEEFENQLFARLQAIPEDKTVWLEDESRMIGHVYQPDEFYHRLTSAPVVLLEQPDEWRVNRLVNSYGEAPVELLREAFVRIKKKVGGQHLLSALDALDRGDLATAARIALVYYDKAYAHYGEKRRPSVIRTVTAISPEAAVVAAQILSAPD